jgi:hypothetical protein
MNLNFNKELVGKTLLLFGGAILTISLGRCAYNYYNRSSQEQIEQIEQSLQTS